VKRAHLRNVRTLLSSLAALALLVSSGCASTGPYFWVQDLPPSVPQEKATYVIATGDVLSVTVRQDDRLSTKTKVRTDGRITLSLVGEVDARGHTLGALARELTKRLTPYIEKPSVTVSLEDTRPLTVTVLGELARPGVYALEPASGVLEALASAGGLTEFADHDQIYVIRKNPRLRIRFTYEALLWNDPSATTFRLAPGDIVTVE
jgi:polysaccharide export outer membrane protein